MTYTATANTFSITRCFDRVCLIQMPSQLTSVEANEFEKQFQQLCQTDSTFKKIIFDFGQTTFIDSSGLIGLRQIVRVAQKMGIDLTFWSFSPQVKMISSLAGLDKVFPIDNGTEAICLDDNNQQRDKLALHPSVCSKSKRLLDICGAIVGLGITAILFVPIAIAIKLDSPGPIFFSQIRCGYMGKRFRIWKFRSMVANAEQLKDRVENKVQGPLFKNENDPRITRVGRFLRKTSLDEFPQFWNVLKGEMSLVGTRPPTVQEVENYKVDYGQRLNVKPGLTGEWQVNGRSKITDFAEVMRLDLQYQQNWSLLYDLKLILKTIRVIFSKKSGAC